VVLWLIEHCYIIILWHDWFVLIVVLFASGESDDSLMLVFDVGVLGLKIIMLVWSFDDC